MSTNSQFDRPGKSFRTSIVSFRSAAPLRNGGMRAVTLEDRGSNAGRIFGETEAIQESIEEAFGKAGHDVQLAADHNLYNLSLSATQQIKRRTP